MLLERYHYSSSSFLLFLSFSHRFVSRSNSCFSSTSIRLVHLSIFLLSLPAEQSQLRFYWDKGVDDCIIKQCTGAFRYGYEYMGLNGA